MTTATPTLYVFHVAMDDTRFPARFVVTVVAENETAARHACRLDRAHSSIAWISCIGTEDAYMNRENGALQREVDAFNAGHALGIADAAFEDGR